MKGFDTRLTTKREVEAARANIIQCKKCKSFRVFEVFTPQADKWTYGWSCKNCGTRQGPYYWTEPRQKGKILKE